MAEEESDWVLLHRLKTEKFNADRARFLRDAIDHDDGGWTKHTQYHWSRAVAGERLDYWPSRKKFQYKGRVQRGDVGAFIKKVENEQGSAEGMTQ